MTDAMHLVLIVEDDSALQNVLQVMFEVNNFRSILAGNAAQGRRDARLHRPDLVLVDLGLPDQDGLSVITDLRRWSAVPIIVLSARNDERQRIAAFDAGADDFVMKPFSPPELLARVRATVRRHVRGILPMAVLQLGDVSIDMSRRVASNRGRELRLTPIEHRILETLARHNERIVTHAALIKEVWGPQREDTGGLRVYIGSLRRKVELDPSRPKYILTEISIGYRLVTVADCEA